MDVEQSRISLLHTLIDNIDMSGAIERIDKFVRSGVPHQVVTVNLDFLRLAGRDHSFRDLINTSSLIIADGMPLVWASRLQGDALPERIAGVDLVRECARLSADRGYRVFFLGAAPGVAERAATVLSDSFPGMQIVGTYAPDSLRDDESATLELIREAAPDILFVALGAPLQDQWIRRNMESLGVPVCVGVGGAFDMLSGRISRAPNWMQRTGLEWLYRLSREPGRLWKRYFVHDLPVFLRLLMWSTGTASVTGVVVPQPATVSEPMEGVTERAVVPAPSDPGAVGV
jgi:N-acetylglucosaminyldiphosphoundecaprenol N-acetyl-beta-D-mannosaminyltransferase